MGTGILAITSMFYSQYLPFLKDAAYFLFYFNVVLFFVLIVPWILRWTFFRKEAIADLENPVISNFYATVAVAMLVLSANFIVIGKDMFLGEVFWFTGTFLTIFFGVLTPYIMFKGGHVKLEHINPAWFIPPVGLIVIPIAGSLIIPQFSGMMQEFIIFLNYFGWGAGFFIYPHRSGDGCPDKSGQKFGICDNQRAILHFRVDILGIWDMVGHDGDNNDTSLCKKAKTSVCNVMVGIHIPSGGIRGGKPFHINDIRNETGRLHRIRVILASCNLLECYARKNGSEYVSWHIIQRELK